jgi:DegV family protein with EDD domain
MIRIAYLDGVRLGRSLIAASSYVREYRGELDRMNVFPVPDGDTGTNLALTLDAVSHRLLGSRERSVSLVAAEAAEAAVLGARGNSGMLLSHFLLGLSEALSGSTRVDPATFVRALVAGAGAVESALERPVEGTILTVARDTAAAVRDDPGYDFVVLLDRMFDAARASLARTPDLLPVLSRAGVVDAGAQGFVHLLEGVRALVRGEQLAVHPQLDDPETSAAAQTAFPEVSERYRFCTEGLVRGDALPDRDDARDHLRAFGDSLLVVRSGDFLKVHIHTDDPDAVFAVLERFGTLEAHKAEDMRAQHEAVEFAARSHVSLARRSVAVVTDSACDLPPYLIEAHGIHVVPLELVEGDRTYRDGVDITAEEFHRRLAVPGTLPTTSQPPPGSFVKAFDRAAEESEAVVGVFVGSTLSGTMAAARSVAAQRPGAPILLADSLGASLLQGLLALKAAELAERAWSSEDIVAELARVRGRSGILFTIRSFDRLRASGRVSLGRVVLARVLGLKPILGVEPDGRVTVVARAHGSKGAARALLELVRERVGVDPPRVRFGVVHVGAPVIRDEAMSWLRATWGPDVDVFTAPATPVLATHLGIGAWGVAYMVDDGDTDR